MNAKTRTIPYFCLLVCGTFWLAYGLGYQHGHQRGGEEERLAWSIDASGNTRQVRGYYKGERVQESYPSKHVNAGPDSVTVR
jgi:hypothetical protein